MFIEETKPVQAKQDDKDKIDLFMEEVNEYIKDICSDGLSGLKAPSEITHVIEVTDSRTFRDKYRAVPHAKRSEFKKLIDELLDEGFIRPSKSPYSSAVNLVKKSDGSIRLTIDYKSCLR